MESFLNSPYVNGQLASLHTQLHQSKLAQSIQLRPYNAITFSGPNAFFFSLFLFIY